MAPLIILGLICCTAVPILCRSALSMGGDAIMMPGAVEKRGRGPMSEGWGVSNWNLQNQSDACARARARTHTHTHTHNKHESLSFAQRGEPCRRPMYVTATTDLDN